MPVTTPVVAFGVPTTGVLTTGARLAGATAGLIATVIAAVAVPPWPSITVTVNPSARSAGVAPGAAAVFRAATVGA